MPTRRSVTTEVRLATHAMGTRFELVLQGDGSRHVLAAGEAAIDVIESQHLRFSRFDPGSLVSHLRRASGGSPVPVDRDTWDLFADAVSVRGASGGVFDPTLGTSWTNGGIELDPVAQTVRLTSPSVELDLGGIAKGHGLDMAVRVLRQSGIERAFLHGGTSSGYGIGRPIGRSAWRIAPAAGDPSDAAPVLDLIDSAFSLSSHGGARHVLVAGPTGRLADAWATALALGASTDGLPDGWQAWIRSTGCPWQSARSCAGSVG